MRKVIPALVAALALGSVGIAAAQTSGSQSGPMNRPMSTPQGGAAGQSGTILTENDVRTKLQMEGYTNISDLKREGNIYSAKAMKNGRMVSLNVDARNGKVQSSGMQ